MVIKERYLIQKINKQYNLARNDTSSLTLQRARGSKNDETQNGKIAITVPTTPLNNQILLISHGGKGQCN